MTPTTITISGEGSELIERLRAGVKSKELIDLFGLKFAGVKVSTYSGPQSHPEAYSAVMTAQEVVVVAADKTPDYKDRVAGWATDIDWNNAPEGFPIWIEGLNGIFVTGWHRDDGDRWVDQAGSYWPKGADERGNCRIHLAPWSFDGLPPAGVEMEFSFKGHDQGTGVVLCYGQEMCFIRNTSKGLEREQCGDIEDYEFRPIKTPAQIASDERDAAIEAMKECFDAVSDELCPTSNEYLKTLFGALYDAGLRFPKGDDQ